MVSMVSSSCNKWLELRPEDGLTSDEYWQTKEQLEAAVVGCYASLLDGGSMPLVKYLFLWGELRADMVQPGFDPASDDDLSALSSITRDEINMIRTDISSTNAITNWDAVYKTINNCNAVIKNAAEVLKTDNTLTQTQLNSLTGEAYGLRALMYFYLLRTFGEVPLKLLPTSTDADIVPLAKSSKEEVYAQILKDAEQAAKNCQPAFSNAAEDKGRITLYTAYAIQADVYLWGEEYQKCIDACDKIISSGKYQLFPAGSTQAEWFNRVFYNGNSVESIFEFQFYEGKLNPFYQMFSQANKELVAAEWITTGGLYGIDNIDAENKDIRGGGTSMLETNGSINKFTGNRTSATSFSHWFVYRYSDILLMKAEALTWVSPGDAANGTAAIAMVNDIRLRRNALPVVSDAVIEEPAPAESLKVTEYILNERAREFAFEGKRWYDILRNAKRNNYEHDEVLMDMVTSSAQPAKQQTVINKYKDRRSHYLPIYNYELQTNKSLIQNSFYQ